MALPPMETSLCNKLVGDYYTTVAPVKAARSMLRKQISDFNTYLKSMKFTPDFNQVQNALNDFEGNVEDALPKPEIDAINQLLAFIKKCPYLAPLSPVTIIGGQAASIFDLMAKLLRDLANNFPEIGAGQLASAINALLKGVGVAGGQALAALLKQADGILKCLDELCGATYSDSYQVASDDLQQLYDDLNIISDPGNPKYGEFNYEKSYDDAGLSPNQREALDITINSVDSQVTQANDAITNTIDSIKNLKKGGFF